MLNKLCDVAPELLIGVAVDVVVQNGRRSLVGRVFGVDDRFDQLLILAGITVVVWVLESITDYIADVLWRTLAQTIEHDTRMEAYAHVQELELAYFEDRSSGGLMSILNDDVNQLERFLDFGANEMILTAANVLFVGITFAVISPTLTVLAFLPIPVIILGSLRYQRTLEKRYDAVRAAAGNIADTLTNNLGGIATIKAFTRRGARGRPGGRGQPGLQRCQRRGHPLLQRLRAAHPHGDPGRLHHDAGRRRSGHHRRRPGRRPVLGARVHDPAPAVAAHPPRRDVRPLPAGHGVVPAHLRPARGAADDPARRHGPRRARCAGRSASRTSASPTPTRPARSSGASTSTSPPARPTRSSAPPAPARAPW